MERKREYLKPLEDREYEALFLYEMSSDVFKKSLENTKELFSSMNVDVLFEEDMGVKRLAYKIKKKRDGHYYFFKLKMRGDMLKEVNRELSLKEDILRYMFVKVEKKFYPKKTVSRKG